jgi:hypothetical protein
MAWRGIRCTPKKSGQFVSYSLPITNAARLASYLRAAVALRSHL